MKSVFLLTVLIMLHLFCFAQIQSKRLKVYSITEYIDGYVIAAIDSTKSDTLNIISVKDTIKDGQSLEKIIVGKEYNFKYEDYINKMAAMPPDNFVIRIKKTVVWRGRDDYKKRPVFSMNTKGLWIDNQLPVFHAGVSSK
jgi:hypothetical protein